MNIYIYVRSHNLLIQRVKLPKIKQPVEVPKAIKKVGQKNN